MPGSNSETRGRFYDDLDSNIVVQYSLGPYITLHGRITAREQEDRLGNLVHPMLQSSRRYFRRAMKFSKTTMPAFTQIDLFTHGFKNMKLNFNNFPRQHNHQI
jgi:hypothetical protein